MSDPPGKDPDGGDEKSSNPVFARSPITEDDDLTERFSQQQVMISQLKEMVLAEEAARNQKIASSRLKMEKCVSQLARIRDRAKGSKLKNVTDSPDSSVKSTPSVSVEPEILAADKPPAPSLVTFTSTPLSFTPAAPRSDESGLKYKTHRSEVTRMLHQQIQGHKAKIAETAKHEKELEEALAKIQKQLEESQSQSAEIIQLSQAKPKISIPLEDNSETNKTIIDLRSKIAQLESTILDLQETCKEKDSVIDSKTKAITLMSADLSMKGKNTLDLLDDTKVQMQQMQENFATMESQMKEEKQRLMDELETSKNRIFYLEEANSILETERFNLSVQNSFFEEQLAEKENEIIRLKEAMVGNMKAVEEYTQKIDKSIETDISQEEKGSREVFEMDALTKKVEILETLNATLRQSNIELQEKISPSSQPTVVTVKDESPKTPKKSKPTKSKGSQKYKNLNPKPDPPKDTEQITNKDMQDTIDRLQVVIQVLNKQILEKEILLSQKEMDSSEIKETSLESSIEAVSQQSQDGSSRVDPEVGEGVMKVSSDDPVMEFDSEETKAKSLEAQLEEALNDIEKLNKQLIEANKSMIKIKATHKKEVKQMQKSIDDFSKVSDTSSEVIKLQSEVSNLSQKIAELEDEKGNLQLHLVDYDSSRVSDSQLHAKLVEVEMLAEERLKAIAELEMQKFDLVQELHNVKQQIISLEDKVADLSYLENEHVSTELASAQLEDKIHELESKYSETLKEINQLKHDNSSIAETVDCLNKEKIEMSNKLEMYIQENIDLIEKLDKLSAEKVSSAESIEMVESLTSQEKMEIEQYHKGIEEADDRKVKSREDIEESLRRNSFSHSHIDNTDLPSNIDIINQERLEFMEKLDVLKVENSSLSMKMEQLLNEKKHLEDRIEGLEGEVSDYSAAIEKERRQIVDLSSEIENLKQVNETLGKQVKELIEKHVPENLAVQSESVPFEMLKDSSSKSTSKTNKNQTKEILRLKNLVKQHENQIECLNEQLAQVKETAASVTEDTLDAVNANLEKALLDNQHLNDEILEMKNEKDLFNQQILEIQNINKSLLDEKESIYTSVKEKDVNISNLEKQLKTAIEQHKSDMDILNNMIQSKDDEITQCKQDIEQLDAVSRKLKSTLSQIEEEKSASIHDIDKIKELEKNLVATNSVILEKENLIKDYEHKIEESVEHVEILKAQIAQFESKLIEKEGEVEHIQERMNILKVEKDDMLRDITRWKDECSAKDEEINEIKLQLRRESLDHDDAINSFRNMQQDYNSLNKRLTEVNDVCKNYEETLSKQSEEYEALDKKYKEQFDKLKKVAINFKKKSALCTELETQVESLKNEIQQHVIQLEETNMKYNQLNQELCVVNSQYNVVQAQLQQSCSKDDSEKMEQSINAMQNQIYDLESQIKQYEIKIETLQASNIQLSESNESIESTLSDMESKCTILTEENKSLSMKCDTMNNELEVKNHQLLKLNQLEDELQEKHVTITNLNDLIEETKSLYNQFKCGQEAKLQEKDIYIESLESEIIKHKDRILRLEDSVSTMEERRASLERKTDHLVTKLSEKDAECSESSIHEDELEKRLTALMEHDDLIQKQLNDTQQENTELLEKIHNISDSVTIIKAELEASRTELISLKTKANHLEVLEEEKHNLSERVGYLENELKRVNVEFTEIIKQKTKEYEYLESEFNSFMSNTEAQRRLSREEYDKLQDQMSSQSQVLKELQQENEWLKAENETISLEKVTKTSIQQVAVPQFNFAKFDPSSAFDGSSSKIKELTHLLSDKDKQISHLTSQLQTLENSVESLNNIKEIDSQFKSCLSQLEETIESEKSLKQNVAELSKEISCQVDMVKRLEDEIASLNAIREQYKNVECVVESTYQMRTMQEVHAHKIDSNIQKLQPEQQLDTDKLQMLESQIIASDIQDSGIMSEAEKKMIRNFEHDPPEPVPANISSYFQSNEPVTELPLEPKKAFECFKGDSKDDTSKSASENPFDEEDGWGWGNQESVLEDVHLQTADSGVSKISEMELTIQTLISERDRLKNDLQQSQQKTAKALLKLKEFKNKNETLINEIKNLKLTSDFNMLDMTIQDELASQVGSLQEKIKELSDSVSKEKQEKDNLLKRIDVLTSANERLMEMKEKQDIEMEICRNQNKRLDEKIKNLDWDNSFSDDTQTIPAREEDIEPVSDSTDVFNMKDKLELIKKIQDLEADNEELQAFVEEQQTKLNTIKTIECDYEKLKVQSESIINGLKEEVSSLKQNIHDMNLKCENYETIISQFHVEQKTNADKENVEDIKNENAKLQLELNEKQSSYNTLKSEVDSLMLNNNELVKENNNLKYQLEVNEAETNTLNHSLNILNGENSSLKNDLLSFSEDRLQNSDLRNKLEALVKEYYEFQEKFNDLAIEKDKIEIDYNNIVSEKEKLEMLYKDVSEQEAACKTELIKLSYEKDELIEKYEKLLTKQNDKNANEESENVLILTDKLNQLNNELNEKNDSLIQLNMKLEEYDNEKLSLQTNLNKIQVENQHLANNLTELHMSVNEAVDRRGMEVAEVWKQHVAMRETEFMNIEQALRQELDLLKSNTVSAEIQTTQPSELLAIDEEDLNNKLENTAKELDEVKTQLDEKEKHILQCENQIALLQEKYSEVLKERDHEMKVNMERSSIINTLTSELENFKVLHNNVISSYDENVRKNDLVNSLIETKEKELQDNISRIEHMAETYKLKMNDYEVSLSNKESELDNVRQQLYTTENRLADSQHEHEAELADMRLRLHAERTQYDQIISELKTKVEKLETHLESKIDECKSLNMKIESMIEEENSRLNELKKALESQEIEIVTLKENLLEQTDSYEKLMIANMQEIHKLKANRHVTFSEETKPGADIEIPTTSETSEDPTKAELDLALYMLHQRDVRCEELTVELTQLLEERDTLQLKLSNALRMNEQLRCKVNPSDPSSSVSLGHEEEKSVSTVEHGKRLEKASVTEVGEMQSDSPEMSADSTKSLQSKLSQLHRVGHMRDIRLKDEREQRMRQMELLQKDLQHLPPEAAARLREAHFTLTRDTQSTSTLLLNWLWGKTTPKVVHM